MASSSTPEKKQPKIRQVKDSCPSLTKMLKDLSKLKPTKTLEEMHNDVALMKSFLPNENETRQLQDIPPPELDAYLSRFLLSVRKVC